MAVKFVPWIVSPHDLLLVCLRSNEKSASTTSQMILTQLEPVSLKRRRLLSSYRVHHRQQSSLYKRSKTFQITYTLDVWPPHNEETNIIDYRCSLTHLLNYSKSIASNRSPSFSPTPWTSTKLFVSSSEEPKLSVGNSEKFSFMYHQLADEYVSNQHPSPSE